MFLFLRICLGIGVILGGGYADCFAATNEARLALIIANTNYIDHEQWDTPLNSGNDAVIAKAALEQVGFDVRVAHDLNKVQFLSEVKAFSDRVRQAERATVVVYYAGHGTSFEAENYLVPVDGQTGNRASLEARDVKLSEVVALIEQSGIQRAFIFVDACRDSASTRGQMHRRTQMTGQNPGKTARIIFSTAPGQAAANGPTGKYSPFAEAFADEIIKPGQNAQFFKAVTDRVLAATQGTQLVWKNAPDDSSDAFCFAHCGSEGAYTSATKAPDLQALGNLNAHMRILAMTAAFDAELPSMRELASAYTSCSPTGEPFIYEGVSTMRGYCEAVSLNADFDDEGRLDPKYVAVKRLYAGGYIPADIALLLRRFAPDRAQTFPAEPDLDWLQQYCRRANPDSTARQCADWLKARFGREKTMVLGFPRQRLVPKAQPPLIFPRLTAADGSTFADNTWSGRVDLGKRDGCGLELLNDGRIVIGCFTADALDGIVRVVDPKRGWWIREYDDGRPTENVVPNSPLLPARQSAR